MENKKRHDKVIGEQVVESLKGNFFDAIYFETSGEAATHIMDYIKEGDKIGFGGSMTISGMGIQKKSLDKKAIVLDHNNPELSKDEKLAVKRQQLTCDLFLCSSNAITLGGELVNIDCVGNRVGAMTFGPQKVIIAVGVNKICLDTEDAYIRIETKAAPLNLKKLNWDNPCIKTGVCMDCHNNTRGCRIYSVIKRKPMQSDITVLVIGEELGY
jgi:hypothetical protein